MNIHSIQTEVIEPRPPKWARMLGRKYWKGWYCKAWAIDKNGMKVIAQTKPAKRPPNPIDVNLQTLASIQMLDMKLEG